MENQKAMAGIENVFIPPLFKEYFSASELDNYTKVFSFRPDSEAWKVRKKFFLVNLPAGESLYLEEAAPTEFGTFPPGITLIKVKNYSGELIECAFSYTDHEGRHEVTELFKTSILGHKGWEVFLKLNGK